LRNDDDTVSSDINNLNSEFLDYRGNFSATINLAQNQFFKGESINFTFEFSVFHSPVLIDSLLLEVSDLVDRSALQSFLINTTYTPGNYSLDLQISPGFNQEGLVVLTDKEYELTELRVSYKQLQKWNLYRKPIGISLQGELKPEYYQRLIWTTQATENITISSQNNSIEFTSLNTTGFALMNTTIETTGYTRLYFNITGIDNSTVEMSINNTKEIFQANESTFLPIGVLQGKQDLNFSIFIEVNDSISISVGLSTRHVPILAVIASNHWTGHGNDELLFREPEYYLSQVSTRFENALNVTFVIVAMVNFESTSGSDLFLLADEAKSAVGSEFNLPSGNWTTGPGTQLENAGADILIILTNKTMDHLGIVLGSHGFAYNMAIHARGSALQISPRLPPSFADNLIQHELSHIFGAPDRWTSDDPPSVMTKSHPEDVLVDYIIEEYWLKRIDWLEEDIQVMVERATLYV
jgi:hypothetical protein